jgi:hypothetical protein
VSSHSTIFIVVLSLDADVVRHKLQLEERAGESSARRKWRSFREALMSVCSAKDIERLKRRLVGFRDELEVHLIMALK